MGNKTQVKQENRGNAGRRRGGEIDLQDKYQRPQR